MRLGDRQAELGRLRKTAFAAGQVILAGGVVLALTGSGNSENVLRALSVARERGARSVALAGFDGGKVKGIAEVCLVVPTGRIEQAEDAHLILQHILCTYLRGAIAGDGGPGAAGHK